MARWPQKRSRRRPRSYAGRSTKPIRTAPGCSIGPRWCRRPSRCASGFSMNCCARRWRDADDHLRHTSLQADQAAARRGHSRGTAAACGHGRRGQSEREPHDGRQRHQRHDHFGKRDGATGRGSARDAGRQGARDGDRTRHQWRHDLRGHRCRWAAPLPALCAADRDVSLTLGGALKTFLEAQGLGLAVYTDRPPPRGHVSHPYCIVTGDINLVLDKLEDSAASTGAEEVQLDLYQQWRNANDQVLESPTLADAITDSLEGSRIGATYGAGATAKIIYAVLQRARRRLLNENERIVRHIYQLDVVRQV